MAQNTIYFPFGVPPVTGGDFVAIEHIAGLNRLGFDAKALYMAPDMGHTQFAVPTVRFAGLALKANDIVVIGEIHKQMFEQLRKVNCKKVLHNQAPFYTFIGFDSVQQLNDYPLTHIITSSNFARTMLRDLGITKPIRHVRPFIPSSFAPAEKHLQIVFSPNKRPHEPSFVMGCFKSKYPEFANIPWLSLTRMSRAVCAQIMAQSAIYAAFPLLEGLGLMNLEAMASGCHVVGYTGTGGIEYATDDNGMWIDDGDHDAYARKLKEACELFRSKAPNRHVENGIATARAYSPENFEAQLKEAYLDVMAPMANNFRN